MALLSGELPGAEQVELDCAGDFGDAQLTWLAGGEVAGLLGLARPLRSSPGRAGPGHGADAGRVPPGQRAVDLGIALDPLPGRPGDLADDLGRHAGGEDAVTDLHAP